MSCRRWIAGLALLASLVASADEAPKDISDLQLDELLTTNIASQKSESLAETPGVVTVITREEILGAGARDLVDVLQLVPGFSAMATDVDGVTDFGFRGIWGHEGKVLLMVDGEPLNELLFDDNELALHFPVEQMQEIDIIRGPGSVQYGGYAELAVINIITRSAHDLEGGAATITYGQMAHALGQLDLNVAAGKTSLFGVRDLDVTAWVTTGQGQLSDRNYTDFYGSSYFLGNSSNVNPLWVNVGVRYHDLHLRFLYDGYSFSEADSYGGVQPFAATQQFLTAIADGYDEIKLGRLTITPRLTYKWQQPWRVTDTNSEDYFATTVERFTAKLTVSYDFTPDLSLMLGTEDYIDHAWVEDPAEAGGSQNLFADGATRVTYWNLAGFGEVRWHSVIGNLTAGARYEHNNLYGDSFVPRIALTKAIDHFHFKLLYAFAFRAPGIEDIALSPTGQITPEHTRTAEIEVGYQLGHLNLIANAFDITILDPIVYSDTTDPNDPTNTIQAYVNYPRTGTEGVELQARLRYDWGFINASYSFYSAFSIFAQSPKNTVDLYMVPGNSSELLAFPQHKVALNAKINVWRGLSVAPSGFFISERPGYLTGDGQGDGVFGESPPLLMLNLFVQYSDLVIPGLDLGVGVYNLLNVDYEAIQAYNSGHAPLALQSRELVARLSYRLPF